MSELNSVMLGLGILGTAYLLVGLCCAAIVKGWLDSADQGCDRIHRAEMDDVVQEFGGRGPLLARCVLLWPHLVRSAEQVRRERRDRHDDDAP